jgi:hypothetical protein
MRLRRELNQAQPAKLADLHPTWNSNIECGKVNLTWGNFRRLAYALEVQVPELAELAELPGTGLEGRPANEEQKEPSPRRTRRFGRKESA